MTREYNATRLDVDLKVRVELALNAWAKGQAGNQSGNIANRVLVFAKSNGEITLRGSVYSRGASEEAMAIARTIPGVRLVFNQIATTRNCWPLVSTNRL